MKREYTSAEVSTLAEFLRSESPLADKKLKIEEFYSKHISATVRDDANRYVGKLLLRFFIAVNVIVVAIVIIFSGLDIAFHINDAENRFIDGNVLGGLVTATIAQAVAAYIAFTKFINN
ncbi:MAG: hypothetical protein ACK5LJ_10925 [Paracoccus sp. (in: a-proteobacteria)]